MRIARTFVWQDGPPDGYDEIRSVGIDHRVFHQGLLFRLREWDIRYVQGSGRVTEAIYEQLIPPGDGQEAATRYARPAYLHSSSFRRVPNPSHSAGRSGKRDAVSSALHTVRYPTGVTEYRISDQPPNIGDVVTRNGDSWVVRSVTETRDGTLEVVLGPGESSVGRETPAARPTQG